MHRTQIYLAEDHRRLLKARASREGKSIAALIREILDQYFGLTAQPHEDDPLERAIGIGEGTGEPVSENVEDYLYGSQE